MSEIDTAKEILVYINRRYGGNPMYDSTWIDGIAEIVNRGAASEWVDVRERMPDTFKQVLVCLKPVPEGPDWYPRTNTFLGWHKRGIWFGAFVNPLTGIPESGEFPDDIITHWKEIGPLPQAPTEEAERG